MNCRPLHDSVHERYARSQLPRSVLQRRRTFVAGYLVALLDGLPSSARLQQGSRCGAFAFLGPGDWESLPRRADLDGFASGDPVIR